MPEEVRIDVAGRLLTLTNLDKVLYPEAGFTKAEVIDYYHRIAPVILPHLADRVVTRLRLPNGTGAPSFFEKNAPAGIPDWVRRCHVRASDTDIQYLVVEEVATLVLLANYAALELHTPQWRIPADVTFPLVVDGSIASDLVMIDLDPGVGTDLPTLATAALIIAAELAADGLIPVPRTSGNKGLQLQAAIAPSAASEVTEYVRRLGVGLEGRYPDMFVTTQVIAQRTNKILIDFMQNYAQRNTITSYSLRGRERPSVCTPVTWDEVAAATEGAGLSFTSAEVLARVERHGDLAAELLVTDRPPLPGNP
ncbi:MAG: non-homologous end-joining DNA ligase [Micropruina sp.]